MREQYIQPFAEAVCSVLGQFGVEPVTPGDAREEENVISESGLVVMIGIIGKVSGNITFAFSQGTAIGMASTMMMGMPVESLGEMEVSALAELCNMFAGNAISALSDPQQPLDITPPSVVMGDDMFVVLGSENGLAQRVETSLGHVELKLGIQG